MAPATADERSVVVVGHVCIDENTGTDSGDSSPQRLRRSAGSPAFFMNRQLRTVPGVTVSVIAPYSDDFVDLRSGVPLLNPATPGGTLLYRNHIEGDVRRQECFHSQNADPVPLTSSYARALAHADIVVVAPLLANFTPEYLTAALAETRPGTLTMLLLQGYLRTVGEDGTVGQRDFVEYADVIPLFDVVVFSDEDLGDALAVADRWSREFPGRAIVVTQNRHGATGFENGVATHVPAKPLERQGVGSVIGAGDVFSAALALSYRESRDIRDAISRAHGVTAGFIDGELVAALAA
ncbi:carbohydrate kinase family protein [Subtercola boreus]|nr:carbohydrate kinase family protein [Subtercola boreus]TQL54456.1 sugar/nucleoside kinase (ribokinase family) [Subtercola boreus]